MATPSTPYDEIYLLVRNSFTNDQTIWTRTYEYIRQHPKDFFFISPNRRWSIAHQIIYHGALKVFKEILELYNEKNPIDIFSTTKDAKPQTILDVARDRKGSYNEQYQYIEHLFLQDKFIRACRDFDWPSVDNMLIKDPSLLNEKPPYYSNYLIHYLVLFGDPRIFGSYSTSDNRLRFDLKNADGKTALDLARENNNQDLIDEIRTLSTNSTTQSIVVPTDRDDYRRTPSPPSVTPPRPARESATLPKETLKRITCRLTNKIFVNPVRASDGHTYERDAIIDYFQNNRYSPATGEAMNDSFSPDIPMRNFINDLRRKNLIP